MNEKTRNLSPVEYIKVLEIEWWICNFRRKICDVPNDRRHYGKVANLKKERLIGICERNNLPHIFSDPQLMSKLNKSFNPDGGGCPNFEGRKDSDLFDYYSFNSDVRCFYGFDNEKNPIVKIGKVKYFDLANKKVEIFFPDLSTDTLDIHKVSRIF